MKILDLLRQNAGLIVMLAIAVAAFGFAYLQLSQNAPERETTVNGVKVIARGSVKNALMEILSPQTIATQVLLDGESDSRPCKVPMQTEVIYALAASGKNVSFQLAVRTGGYCVEKGAGNSTTRVQCVAPRLVIENGECDCVKLDSRNQTVLISGREEWLCSSGPNVREVIRWALAKE